MSLGAGLGPAESSGERPQARSQRRRESSLGRGGGRQRAQGMFSGHLGGRLGGAGGVDVQWVWSMEDSGPGWRRPGVRAEGSGGSWKAACAGFKP